ncbi:MAG: acyltransferase family protein [Acidimicrobiales bacterium]
MDADASRTLRYMPALDGLRGLAVLGVIAFHAGHLRGGYLGVDLFFVLSGFLITSLLLVEHGVTGRIGFGHFWGRRARRLLPALLLVLAFVALYALVWATPPELERIRGDGLATLFYVANWHAIAGNGSYWAMFSEPSPLQHTWSLAIEEQFYLLWPFVVVGVLVWLRRSPKVLFWVCVGGAAASALSLVVRYVPGTDPSRLYYGTDTRIAAILLGAALGASGHVWGPVTSRRGRWWLEGAGLVGVAVLVWAWCTVDGQDATLYRGGLLACGVAATAVIAAASHPEAGPIARILGWAPLVAAGIISYGLYLWHWPIFVLISPDRTGWPEPMVLTARLAVTLAVAVASYLLVEKPIRRGRLATRPALILAPTAAVVVAVALVLTTVPPSGGPSQQDVAAALVAGAGAGPGEAAPPTTAPTTTPGPDTEGSPPSTAPPTTKAGRPVARATAELGHPPKVLVFGDSVAFSIAAGIVPVEQTLGVDVESKAIIACGVARGNGRVKLPDGTISTEIAECHDWEGRWGGAIDTFRPDLVLLVVGWAGNTQRDLDGVWRGPCDPVFDPWYANEVRDALRILTSRGTPVAMTTAPYYEGPKAVPDNDAKIDCLNRIYRTAVAETPGVTLVDLAAYICPDGRCRTEENGITLRPDGLHFDGPAGTLVGAWLLDRGLEAAGY